MKIEKELKKYLLVFFKNINGGGWAGSELLIGEPLLKM